MAAQWHWLTTTPSGRAHTHGADDGQTGWRLHAIWADEKTPLGELRHTAAVCGLRPGSGWGLDLFIERRCATCVKRLQKLGFLPRDESARKEPTHWRKP